jgi:DNA-binding response OmpR family regulator/archaellum biogenesis ATPase FlaH
VRPTGAGIVDHVLGGYPPGLPLVVAGPSGCGRTVLGLQLAHGALARGEIVQFVSSEPAPSLIQQADALGLPLGGALRSGQLVLLELDGGAAALIRAQGAGALADALRRESADASLVVVDPFTALTAEIVDEPRLREVARALVRGIAVQHLVLTVESERLAQQRGLDRVLSELCGAYLVLDREASGRRTLTVEKTRTGVGASESVEFAIGPGGTHLVGDAMPVAAIGASPPVESVSDAAWVGPSANAAASATPTPPRSGARQAPPDAAKPDPDEPAARPTVLVVEDSRLQRELVSDWLGDRYEVITASDGFEALAVLLSRRPDLVILDLIMPRVTGYELLSAMRRANLGVPVLVASSRVASAGERLGPLVLGATDFIAKPVNRLELEHKVETLLQLRRTGDGRFDAAEAEALFGKVSSHRLLESADFRERLARACRFGERYELPSSLVRLTAPDSRALERWIEAANQELRFEDAILRVGKREALVLLVATAPGEAPKVVERLGRLCDEAAGKPSGVRFTIEPATVDSEPFDAVEPRAEES